MHKFCSLNCEVSHSDLPIHSDDEFIEACKVTQTALYKLHENLNTLSGLTEKTPDSTISAQFTTLKNHCRELIENTEYRNNVLFDGHIDVDIVFTGTVKDTVRIRIPNLIDKLHAFHSNFHSLTSTDSAEFARQARISDTARIRSNATIQGVRLNTFMSRTLKADKLAVVNSLTGLTGLYGVSYGNIMVGPENSQDTGMPLHCGCVYINSVPIPESDGTVNGLIQQINNSTGEHGVCADGAAGQTMVFVAQDGRQIDIRITNQSAAWISGIPLGGSGMPAGQNGMILWMNFRQIENVRFDSQQTGQLLTGKHDCAVPLKPHKFDSLSLETDEQRQLSRHVLHVMQTIVVRESYHLDVHLNRLQQLFSGQQKIRQPVISYEHAQAGRLAR